MSCIFCAIVAKEVSADIMYENPYVVAFSDINPLAKIHVVLVPKVCVRYLHDLEREYWRYLAAALKELVIILELGHGYRIINNNGINGGQTVDHVHLHILGGEVLGHQLAGV